MSAVICHLVEVINIDLGTSSDFVANSVLSKLGKHGLDETRISMQHSFSSPVMWQTGSEKAILNETWVLFPVAFISIL